MSSFLLHYRMRTLGATLPRSRGWGTRWPRAGGRRGCRGRLDPQGPGVTQGTRGTGATPASRGTRGTGGWWARGGHSAPGVPQAPLALTASRASLAMTADPASRGKKVSITCLCFFQMSNPLYFRRAGLDWAARGARPPGSGDGAQCAVQDRGGGLSQPPEGGAGSERTPGLQGGER